MRNLKIKYQEAVANDLRGRSYIARKWRSFNAMPNSYGLYEAESIADFQAHRNELPHDQPGRLFRCTPFSIVRIPSVKIKYNERPVDNKKHVFVLEDGTGVLHLRFDYIFDVPVPRGYRSIDAYEEILTYDVGNKGCAALALSSKILVEEAPQLYMFEFAKWPTKDPIFLAGKSL
jgi:hypothetical protein